MDVLYFYKERTRFIRQFYDTAAIPFEAVINSIEDELPPFDDPPYSEDGEPAYLVEWIEASEALEVLGRTCLSMLSPSLQLYFKTWERELGVQWDEGERKKVFKNGFVEGYMACFEQVLGISRQDCPADFTIIEQIVLARNRDQHPDQLTTMRVNHSKTDREKHGHLFFMNKQDSAMFSDSEIKDFSFLDPAVHVSRDHLLVAIGETEKLSGWLEEHMIAKRWGR